MTSPAARALLNTLACGVVRQQLMLLREHEPGARTGQDPEDVHDMRVATRRLRAALRTFDQVLPADREFVDEELRWLGDGLAAVRDLDVQLERVHALGGLESPGDREALEALEAALSREHTRARSELNELLDSERYAAILSHGADLLTRPVPQRAEDVTVGGAAYELVERPFRRFRKSARRLTVDSPPADFHKARKRARLLRYTVEFVGDAFPRASRRFVRRLVALQDVLGKHQDAEVALGELREVAQRSELSPSALFALGQLGQRYADEAAELRSQFAGAYAGVVGKRWRTLRRESG
ncbi:MAG: CHAD domain-containing protein [Chloroflexi bacterium]|nr:CHAD domain-containing protein [Chloroflexota bacterium]